MVKRMIEQKEERVIHIIYEFIVPVKSFLINSLLNLVLLTVCYNFL